MKTLLQYCACKETAGKSWVVLAAALLVYGCGAKEQEHIGHQAVNSHSTHNAHLHNSTPGSRTTHSETNWNALATNKTVIAKQQAIQPEFSDINFLISANGYIAFDVRRNRKVAVRAGGRIERLFVKYNYQYVRKGEKILELYSPEINTYVEEYLYIKRQANDSVLLNKARQKLLFLGLTTAQLGQIDQSGQASFTISLYSPFEGYVLFDPSGPSGASMKRVAGAGVSMNDDMGGTPSSPPSATTTLPDNSIREGMYVGKEQALFWINDFKVVWGIIAFAKENEKYISTGLPVTIRSELEPEKPMQASVQFIEPVYKADQKFTQARVHLPNDQGLLKQNSLITATMSLTTKSLTLPAGSVYYLGNIAIVWVRTGMTKEGNNIFQSRVVRTGRRGGGKVEIAGGLKEGEFVARDAGYLADSEAIISY